MKKQQIQLIIVSPEHILYEGNVEHVTFPGSFGSFTVLPEHAPLISSLEKGTIKYSEGGKVESIEIESGFVEINDNIISACIEQ